MPAPPPERPVAFFANGYGDALIALPALRALAARFDGRLTFACRAGARHPFHDDLPLREIVEVPMWWDAERRHFDPLALAERLAGCDLLVSLVPWSSTSLDGLQDALRPAPSIGFSPRFDVALARDRSKHDADRVFDAVRALDPAARIQAFATPPSYGGDAEAAAARILARVPSQMRVLTVHTDTLQLKMWPAERFRQVLATFLDRHPDVVALVVDPVDHGLAGDPPTERVIPCPGLSLDVAWSLVAASDLFLGVDSSMLHAADLARVPGVALFGPTRPAEFGFRFGRGRHVAGEASMLEVSEHAVLAALEQVAGDHAPSRRALRTILSASLGDAVRPGNESQLVEGRQGLASLEVLRAPANAPPSVVVKWRPDAARRAEALRTELSALEFLAGCDGAPVPRYHGGSAQAGVLVVDRVAGQPLSTGLDDPAGDGAALLTTWARAFGRLQAATAGQEAAFTAERERVGLAPERPAHSLPAERLQAVLAELGLAEARHAVEEVGAIARDRARTPLRAFLHGDPCPDNVLVDDAGRATLIDFEHGRFGPALDDLAAAHAAFPRCWCTGTVDQPTLALLEAAYREAVVGAIPQLGDDGTFADMLAAAAAWWAMTALARLWPPTPGPAARRTRAERLPGALLAFAETAERLGRLPALAAASAAIAGAIQERWAIRDLPHYLALPADGTEAADAVLAVTASWRIRGRNGAAARGHGRVGAAAAELHAVNAEQWRAEDAVRRPGATDAEVAAGKREIDRLNLRRHRAIERLDERLLASLPLDPRAELHSETPGLIADRLSVLALRIEHTAARALDDPRLRPQLAAVEEQFDDLHTTLGRLLAACRDGRVRFRRYPAHKLYDGGAGPEPARAAPPREAAPQPAS